MILNTGIKPQDIRDSQNKKRPVCDVCARSKGTRTSFKPIHDIRGKLFGDFTSVDIASYSVPSRDGYVYVLTFTDHASKKSKSYPLTNNIVLSSRLHSDGARYARCSNATLPCR